MSIDSGTRREFLPPAVDAGSVAGARAAVPWVTVLSLGLALAYADGAWAQILRGATGAIERTQTPFASWLKESTAVAPLFVAAVLGAFVVSARWFGHRNRSLRALVATALLVVAVGTLLSVLVASVSAAFDYHLQVQHTHASPHAIGENQATLALHVRGVWYTARWLLLTNLVVVGWLVAMWGGRLRVAARHDGRPATVVDTTRLALVLALTGAAAIHAAVAGHHFTEWPSSGLFFTVLAIWGVAVAGMLLGRVSDRLMLLAALGLSVVPLLLWVTSRTTGLPFGPESGVAESIGLPDSIASVLEVVSLATAVTLLRRGTEVRAPAATPHVRALILVGLVGLSVVAVAAAGLSWFDPFGVADIQSTVHAPH
jgi:hypothetical protein